MAEQITQEGILVEDVQPAGIRITQAGVLVEDTQPAGIRITQEGILVDARAPVVEKVSQAGVAVTWSPDYPREIRASHGVVPTLWNPGSQIFKTSHGVVSVLHEPTESIIKASHADVAVLWRTGGTLKLKFCTLGHDDVAAALNVPGITFDATGNLNVNLNLYVDGNLLQMLQLMLKSTYDTDDNGQVDKADDADKLGGVAAADYLTESEHTVIGDGAPHHARYADSEAVAATVAAVHAADSKDSPVDADETLLLDSAATYGLKKLTWANIKTCLGGLYAALVHAGRHKHGGADEIATTTPAANAIPKADALGTISDWVDYLPVDRLAEGLAAQMIFTEPGATFVEWRAFDWTLAAVAVGSYMVHAHNSDANGGSLAGSSMNAASEGARGSIELDTVAEVKAGTDTERAVTAAGLASIIALVTAATDGKLKKSGLGELTLAAALAYTLTITANASIAGTNSGDVSLAASADELLILTAQAISLSTKAVGMILAGPLSGAAAVPTFKALSTVAVADGFGKTLFNAADGLLLLGPGCPMTPTGWTSLRGQTATLSGAFQQVAGRWPGTRALRVEAAATNVLRNPVGNSTTYWSIVEGAMSQIADSAATNGTVVRGTANAGAGNWYVHQATDTIALTTGEKYTLKVRVRGSETLATNLYIYRNWTGIESVLVSVTTQWQTFTLTGTVDSTTSDVLRAIVDPTAAAAGQWIEVDWIQLEKSAYATSLVWGGAGTGYAWTGTPHASTSTRAATYCLLSAHAGLLSDQNTVTHSLWVQASYDATNPIWPNTETESYILSYSGADANNRTLIRFNNAANALQVYMNGATRISVLNNTFKAGDWLHIVLTADYINDVYNLYLNGALIGTSMNAMTAPAVIYWGLGLWYAAVGRHGGWSYGEYAVLGSVWTAEEVAARYASGAPLADMGAFRRPGIYILDGEFDLRSNQTGARVQIDVTGISAYSATAVKTVSIETDGDAFFGSNINAPATTALAVFANAQTYNSENVGAGDVLLGDNSAGKFNLYWDVLAGALSMRCGASVRIALYLSEEAIESIVVGQVAASQNNILISGGAISIRNNITERVGITAAGILTIKDSAGAAVITLDASAGAEITKKLTMPGASSAISIGATPPTAADAGTGIWIDRTGFYSLTSNVYQVKIDAANGKLYAGAGDVILDVNGITLLDGNAVVNQVKWDFGDGYPPSIYAYDTGVFKKLLIDNIDAISSTGIEIYCESPTGTASIGLTNGIMTFYGLKFNFEDGLISFTELSEDLDGPNENQAIIWLSNGTGKGDDGDVLIASKAGGTTKYAVLFDHSAGSAW